MGHNCGPIAAAGAIPARAKSSPGRMPRYAPRDDGGAVYSEDEDAEQHLTMLQAQPRPLTRGFGLKEPRCLQPAEGSGLSSRQ